MVSIDKKIYNTSFITLREPLLREPLFAIHALARQNFRLEKTCEVKHRLYKQTKTNYSTHNLVYRTNILYRIKNRINVLYFNKIRVECSKKLLMEICMKKILIAFTAFLASLGLLAPQVMADDHGKQRIVLISHAPDSDSWWNTIKNALNLAGDQVDVKVEYRNPPTGDIADMARLIEQASASNPDGIITTLADPNVLSGSIKKAVAKGIPVIIMNSGTPEQAAEVGALMYVGQPEYDAGLAAGKRAKRDGVGSFLCVNHVISNPVVAERCRGFADGLGVDLGKSMIDSGQDPAEIKNKVKAYLKANPKTDAVLTLGPTSADPTIQALKENGMAGSIYFGTFDLGAEIVKAIKEGVIQWGIDQQPFLQAYLPVVVIANYNRYGVLPGNNINSGPGFITKDALEYVEKYAGKYR